MRLPANTKTVKDLEKYLDHLKNGFIKEFQTGASQSLHKWEVLIEWAKKKKKIPGSIYQGSCGLCIEHKFYLSNCEGCPLYIKMLPCYFTKFWYQMKKSSYPTEYGLTDPKKKDVDDWIKAAEEFYTWMKNILEKEERSGRSSKVNKRT